jgi:hypothetical protein
MKKPASDFLQTFLEMHSSARRAAKPVSQEATMDMDKVNHLYLQLSPQYARSRHVLANTYSDSPSVLEDKRIAQLLVLLRQLQRSAGGLCGLPKPELTEIVSSAVRLCGFVTPVESREVIATVLDALEMKDPISEGS